MAITDDGRKLNGGKKERKKPGIGIQLAHLKSDEKKERRERNEKGGGIERDRTTIRKEWQAKIGENGEEPPH